METKKQPNYFIISTAGVNIDTTIVTIEEMQLYLKQWNRRAIVATEKKTYDELDKMNYQLVFNYKLPKVMSVNTRNKPYLDVYTFLLEKYKSGLLIAEGDTISDAISELICKSDNLKKNDIDIMICRDGLESMTENEMRKANFLRIHADPDINLMIFQKIGEIYQEKILTLMVSQLFANEQYTEVNSYIEKENKKYSEMGFKDFVDYYELNKQLSYFVYVDVVNNKILNIDKETLQPFLLKMKSELHLPMTDSEIPSIAESLTVM